VKVLSQFRPVGVGQSLPVVSKCRRRLVYASWDQAGVLSDRICLNKKGARRAPLRFPHTGEVVTIHILTARKNKEIPAAWNLFGQVPRQEANIVRAVVLLTVTNAEGHAALLSRRRTKLTRQAGSLKTAGFLFGKPAVGMRVKGF
jgi:hypothetical protein